MLIDIHTGRRIDFVPFADTFALVRRRLSASELADVLAEIDERIRAAGDEIATAGWLPGANWDDTPFDALYRKAARFHTGLAGKMFGLCVWFAIMQRDEPWGSGRYEKNGVDIGSRTYFRLGARS
jgi:hypothetical protein